MRDGLLTPVRLIEALSTLRRAWAASPAGTLKDGAAADIALIDPELDWTIDAASLCSRSANTPFLDREVAGAVLMTIVGGEVVYESRA